MQEDIGKKKHKRKPEAAIFDVDGTLCDVRSIRHFVENTNNAKGFKRNFKRFHSESSNCPANAQVKQLAQRLKENGLFIVAVTAREEKWSDLTVKWLQDKEIPFDAFYCRPNHDYRPDNRIKSEIAKRIQERYRVVIAVDDRDDIIDVWRSEGIETLKVLQNGTFERENLTFSAPLHQHIIDASRAN
ncbi:hypothetical protein KTJ89_17580 [Brevibacterium sediminis]|uniref:phosphatase domain-containing protein n=1 Tax=Brevibacterium sediminis TaxID=1857024 RepID=UPI002174EF03|nr:HAD family acid phosphatase [Brevibacterium sediminis]MCS4594807.1 hypothetical protein [Brevibacterium sediminis]